MVRLPNFPESCHGTAGVNLKLILMPVSEADIARKNAGALLSVAEVNVECGVASTGLSRCFSQRPPRHGALQGSEYAGRRCRPPTSADRLSADAKQF
jgi:hypothetical protein